MSVFPDNRPTPSVKIHFRTKIGANLKTGTVRLINYYLPAWNNFMSSFSKLEKTKKQYMELPELRKIVPTKIQLSEIMPLFYKNNREMHKLLLDVGPMFDAAPLDLKVFIMAICGITAAEFEDYASENIPSCNIQNYT